MTERKVKSRPEPPMPDVPEGYSPLPREKPKGSTGTLAHQAEKKRSETVENVQALGVAVRDFITVAFLDPVCAPILKRVNRVLLALVKRLSASNAKRGR